MEVKPEVMITWLDSLADLGHGVLSGANEAIQTAAVVGARYGAGCSFRNEELGVGKGPLAVREMRSGDCDRTFLFSVGLDLMP